MTRLNSGALRVAKYAVPFFGLLPLAFGISFALGKLAPDGAQAALDRVPIAITSPASPASSASSASRVALVIANGDYPDANSPLRHPVDDGRALAEELR